MLFAVSGGAPNNIPNNDPQADSHGSACPELSAGDASSGQGGVLSNAAGNKKFPPPCTRSKPAEAKVLKKVVRVESDVAPANAPGSVETKSNPASSSWLPADKRSCRTLAGDGPLP